MFEVLVFLLFYRAERTLPQIRRITFLHRSKKTLVQLASRLISQSIQPANTIALQSALVMENFCLFLPVKCWTLLRLFRSNLAARLEHRWRRRARPERRWGRRLCVSDFSTVVMLTREPGFTTLEEKCFCIAAVSMFLFFYFIQGK